jgi:hypothetical protein
VRVGGKMNVSQQKFSHHMLPEAHVLRHKLLGELHLLGYSQQGYETRYKGAAAEDKTRIQRQ